MVVVLVVDVVVLVEVDVLVDVELDVVVVVVEPLGLQHKFAFISFHLPTFGLLAWNMGPPVTTVPVPSYLTQAFNLNWSAELYEKAVALKNDGAIYNLGLCYKRGEGVEKNLKKAVELYET